MAQEKASLIETDHSSITPSSAQAYEVLQQASYTRIKNPKGGILSWADQVDRSMQKY